MTKCISSCVGALDILSGSSFEASESTLEGRDICVHTCSREPSISLLWELGIAWTTVHCTGHNAGQANFGLSSLAPRPVAQYCSAQRCRSTTLPLEADSPRLNVPQKSPGICLHLLPLCSTLKSPLLPSGMALVCKKVHICHHTSQPAL